MTIDEAIKHCEEVAEDNEAKALRIGRQFEGTLLGRDAKECRECASDHRQLAEWLRELSVRRAGDDARRGHWLISSDGYYPYCSECGFRPKEMTKFCGDCGADMR